ncbi:hypothetical protein BHE74_00041386 [Ensete ventricosum]|nr:hypothetical protein BHE74_00041386 [Ensete ventricosum]
MPHQLPIILAPSFLYLLLLHCRTCGSTRTVRSFSARLTSPSKSNVVRPSPWLTTPWPPSFRFIDSRPSNAAAWMPYSFLALTTHFLPSAKSPSTCTSYASSTVREKRRGRGREKVRVASRRVTVMEAEKKRKDQQKQRKLLSYEELPDYMKENEYIRYHYRAEWPIRNALLSLFSWHNETLNIWT